MKRTKFSMGLTVLAACCVAGCSGSHHDKDKSMQNRIIYSPNGEPLNGGTLGKPTCRDALSHWFERTDSNHDGSVSLDEFMADAQLQFHRMDIDGNGTLYSEELERYRRPYRPPIVVEEPAEHKDGKKHRGKHHEEADDDGTGDGGDPVMSADTNLDFKVTPDEFTIHAHKIFQELDSNHDLLLSRDESVAGCSKDAKLKD